MKERTEVSTGFRAKWRLRVSETETYLGSNAANAVSKELRKVDRINMVVVFRLDRAKSNKVLPLQTDPVELSRGVVVQLPPKNFYHEVEDEISDTVVSY